MIPLFVSGVCVGVLLSFFLYRQFDFKKSHKKEPVVEIQDGNHALSTPVSSAGRPLTDAEKDDCSNLYKNLEYLYRYVRMICDKLQIVDPSDDTSKIASEPLTDIRSASQMLLIGINDLMDFHEIGNKEFYPEINEFDLIRLMSTFFDLFSPHALKKGIPLKMVVKPGLPEILYGDSLRLKQVLVYLIRNAFEIESIEEIRIDIHEEPSRLKEADSLPLLFDIVVLQTRMTADERTRMHTGELGNIGLGYAFYKKLASLINGEIRIVQTSDHTIHMGMYIALGKQHPLTDAFDLPLTDAVQNPLKDAQILLAEDDEINQILVLDILENLGAHVTVVPNGREAVDAVFKMLEQGSCFHAILMDIQMPHMDGMDAARLIRSMEKEIKPQPFPVPIIALTASDSTEDLEKYMESGMTDHIPKPMDTKILIEMLSDRIRMEKEAHDIPESDHE